MSRTATIRPEEMLGTLTEVEKKASPPRLHLRGDRSILESGPRIAVVGSRRPSPLGVKLARLITEELVRQDVTVVSGLAMGIDTEAHRTALARGGRTIAVLGTGLDRCAVAANRALQDEIGERGLLVSQFSAGATPQRSNFPRRNKTMALLSDATLIVEATEDSGTRHQGWEAIRLARPVLFPRKFLDIATARWPTEMIRYGAFAFDAKSLNLVLDELPSRTPGRSWDDPSLPF